MDPKMSFTTKTGDYFWATVIGLVLAIFIFSLTIWGISSYLTSRAEQRAKWDGTGVVISKHYTPHECEIDEDAQQICSSESWYLTIRDDSTGKSHGEYTTQSIYERLEKGSWYHR